MDVSNPALPPACPEPPPSPLQRSVAGIVQSNAFAHGMALLIVLNAVALGLETYPGLIARMQAASGLPIGALLDGAEKLLIAVFCLEALARLFVERQRYFRDRWNLFDASTVLLTLASQAPALSGLRVLRIVRVLRLMTGLRSLRLISAVIFKSLGGSVSITMLMMLLLFVYALIGHGMFGQSHPELFGNLHTAMYTLFRVAAFYAVDDVAQVLLPENPWAYLYLMPYFVVMSYVVLNFFSAIVVYYLYEFSFDDLKRGGGLGSATEPTAIATPDPAITLVQPGITAAQHAELLAEIRSLREDLHRQRPPTPAAGRRRTSASDTEKIPS